jgi:hypothetical protein
LYSKKMKKAVVIDSEVKIERKISSEKETQKW